MKKVLMLLADGVEECEALVTRDVLVRGGLTVDMHSIMNKETVLSSHGISIKCDSYQNLDLSEYDGVILPGGGKGTQNLDKYEKMNDILAYFHKEGMLMAAICAAPMVLGHRGYLKGKKFTCFKGCEEGLDGKYTGEEVERDGNIITGRSMYYSSDFGLRILEYLLGVPKAIQIAKAIKSL